MGDLIELSAPKDPIYYLRNIDDFCKQQFERLRNDYEIVKKADTLVCCDLSRDLQAILEQITAYQNVREQVMRQMEDAKK